MKRCPLSTNNELSLVNTESQREIQPEKHPSPTGQTLTGTIKWQSETQSRKEWDPIAKQLPPSKLNSFRLTQHEKLSSPIDLTPPGQAKLEGQNPAEMVLSTLRFSVVQRAEIECGGVTARHALGRFALNLGRIVNFDNLLNWTAHRDFSWRNSRSFSPHPKHHITHHITKRVRRPLTRSFTTPEGILLWNCKMERAIFPQNWGLPPSSAPPFRPGQITVQKWMMWWCARIQEAKQSPEKWRRYGNSRKNGNWNEIGAWKEAYERQEKVEGWRE